MMMMMMTTLSFKILLLSLLQCIHNAVVLGLNLPCVLRNYSYGSVCVCNATYCDTLDELNLEGPNGFILISSSEAGLRFSVQTGVFNDNKTEYVIDDYSRSTKNNPNTKYFWNTFNFNLNDQNTSSTKNEVQIRINRNIKYQKIIGFGGALTGSVSYNLASIPNALRHQVYKSYFSNDIGIRYNFVRTSIGGCDFDLNPWAYNEYPSNDKYLTNFTQLDYRDVLKINQLKEIIKITKNADIKLFGAAWSPPPWMKTNNQWSGRSNLKSEYYQTWADYHLKFLELMKAENINFWAISTGNEPLNGVIGWLFVRFMSLGWLPENQGKWLAENLGPTLKNSVFANVKIFSNDDQRYTFPRWFQHMDRAYPNSTAYLDGLAVHWYWDGLFGPNLLDLSHKLYSNKIIFNTESCVGDKPWEYHGPQLGSWKRAEKYIKSYIEDFQHSVNGWIDWNFVLDEIGGPNYVKNYVDAPIILNMTSKNEFYKQPIFYGIGHFSKFIHENSVRIEAKSNDHEIRVVGFQRPDKNIVAVIYNGKKTSINIKIFDDSKHHNNTNGDDGSNIVIKIPQKSVHTIILQNKIK